MVHRRIARVVKKTVATIKGIVTKPTITTSLSPTPTIEADHHSSVLCLGSAIFNAAD